jgi:hypothetical protein
VKLWKKWRFMVVSLKVNAENMERHKLFKCKSQRNQNVKQSCLEFKKKDSRLKIPTIILLERTMCHKIWILHQHRMQKRLPTTFGFVIMVQVHIDAREINESIRVGNGDLLIATKIRRLKFKIIQIDGSTLAITLNDVHFVPDLWVNLFRINQALKKVHDISNDRITIALSTGLSRITFDREDNEGIIAFDNLVVCKAMNDIPSGNGLRLISYTRC